MTRPGTLAALPIRLGDSLPEPPSGDLSDFYQRIATKLLGKTFVLASQQPSSLPIPTEHFDREAFVLNLIIEATRSLPDGMEVLVVDTTVVVRPELARCSLYSALATALPTIREQFKSLKVIVLVPEKPADATSQSALKRMRGHSLNHPTFLIYDDGSIVAPDASGNDLSGSLAVQPMVTRSYPSELAECRGNPYFLLPKKLIRRLGHFCHPPAGKHTHCTKFHYDASRCIEEVSAIIRQWLNETKAAVVFYHAPVSTWLAAALHVANTSTGAELVELRGTLNKPLRGPKASGPRMVLTPMVKTGATVTKIYRLLNRHRLSSETRFFSILSTSGDDEKNGRRVVPVNRSTNLEISYALKDELPGKLEAAYKDDDWYKQLKFLREKLDTVILMDEFSASGSTRAGLTNIASVFALRPIVFLSLFDFNPALSERSNIECRTLYRIQLPAESIPIGTW